VKSGNEHLKSGFTRRRNDATLKTRSKPDIPESPNPVIPEPSQKRHSGMTKSGECVNV